METKTLKKIIDYKERRTIITVMLFASIDNHTGEYIHFASPSHNPFVYKIRGNKNLQEELMAIEQDFYDIIDLENQENSSDYHTSDLEEIKILFDLGYNYNIYHDSGKF